MELYNAGTCTLFTPIGEIGIAVHEMHEVTGLPEGDYPYKEFILNHWEFRALEKQNSRIYGTYWEVLCHYFICMDVHVKKESGITPMS